MEAMTSLNISNNNIGKPDEFPEGWSYGLKEGYSTVYEYKHTNGRKQGDPPAGSKSSGLTALADAIKDMGALSVMSLKQNSLCNRETGKVLSEMLAVNTVLKKLDLSENSYRHCDSVGFAQELAVGLSDNVAISVLNLANNNLGQVVGWHLNPKYASNPCGESQYKHSDGRTQDTLPEEGLGEPEGVIALTNTIKTMGMLSKLDVRSNRINQQGKNALQQAWNAAGKMYVRGLSLSSYRITHSCLSALHTGILAVFSSTDACMRLKTAEQMKCCIVLCPIVDCDDYR
jgi:hypothetical protein